MSNRKAERNISKGIKREHEWKGKLVEAYLKHLGNASTETKGVKMIAEREAVMDILRSYAGESEPGASKIKQVKKLSSKMFKHPARKFREPCMLTVNTFSMTAPATTVEEVVERLQDNLASFATEKGHTISTKGDIASLLNACKSLTTVSKAFKDRDLVSEVNQHIEQKLQTQQKNAPL